MIHWMRPGRLETVPLTAKQLTLSRPAKYKEYRQNSPSAISGSTVTVMKL